MELEKYFQSYEDYFWEWDNELFSEEEVFEAIVIPNGKTIAYEKFTFEILRFLSEESFPPLGSLLLAVIATNPDNENTIEWISQLANNRINKSFYHKPDSNFFRVGAAIDFLKILSALPDEYKNGEKRLQLFQTIFKDCHNRVSAEKAKSILDEYQNHRHHLIRAGNKVSFNESNFIKDFRTMALLKAKFPTIQSLLKAMENLPEEELREQVSEEVLEAQIASETPLDFIAALIREEKTFQVGSLVKRIWSGLNIPLHHNMSSVQPLGGISDLSNKGDFDKLIISEFANDDAVFMSRIANSEALYIEREVPPEADKFCRILLIDTTLINWGNPKILGFASALAIATHPKTDIECKIFVVGDRYQEVYFENVNQVIEGLNELSGKLSCEAGLDLFFLENAIDHKKQEVFFISSDESLKLQVMQKAMSTYFDSIQYVLVNQVEGRINIYKNQNKGKKQLQEIIIPLEELWKKNGVVKEQFVFNTSNDDGIPLLYPAERNYQNILYECGHYYMYVGGNLFLFHEMGFKKGFIKIASNLPFTLGKFAIRSNSKGELLLLNYSYSPLRVITIINLATNQCKSSKGLPEVLMDKNLSFFEYEQTFYVTNNLDFWSVESNCNIQPNSDPQVATAFDDYFTKQSLFVQNYKKDRSKYNVAKRLGHVAIVNGKIQINDFLIENLEFVKTRRHALDLSKAWQRKANLILKYKGSNPVTIIKLIVKKTGKSLKDVNAFVDSNLFVILENVEISIAEEFKKELEQEGAVCYIETKFFESGDGSRITNKEGILIFESSDKSLPVFYIPFIIDRKTILATTTEYTGNTYFLSKEHSQEYIDYNLFEEKYLKPFVSKVVQYGV